MLSGTMTMCSNIGHFAIAHHHKTRNVSGEVEFGMEFDCAFVFPIVRPVVLRQTEINRCAVDRVKRIMKFESMSRRTCKGPVENFLEKRLEDI